ncbi:MAG: hypothetical protein IGS49_02090 [Chlorogloeopsis fritschii C42_A2020_084]|uniref:hypothetical protein n=1 Tax=Chlorogloeopsis fritschii TaxID=1124 RepID=UPI0019F025A7|nr:hypothetical protein [Chlorogloeopsis fritschii]MBF2004284.1 hypothetical protein [Chlorogloeopsis fritschii C42_A2020_084]
MIKIANKHITYFYIFAIICSIIYGFLVVKDFSKPLIGTLDEEQWEYAGFYLLKNISFTPFPHLNLVNNQVFYPYGTTSVFQPWGIERDIFYATFYSLFGMGPWIQIYYLLTVLVTLIGSFRLLLFDYGFFRACGSALILTFFNVYAIYKYPIHLSYSIFHWTVLSFITDFLIVKRIVLKQNLSLKLILLRILLLCLSIGQELGYIAGFALMSFSVSMFYIAFVLLYRQFKLKQNLVVLFQTWLAYWRTELFSKPSAFILLLGLCIVTAYAYFPLVFQIAKEAKSFDFTGIPTENWWSHPFRLFIPFLPFFNPVTLEFKKFFGDVPEAVIDVSTSWFLLIVGILGIWQSRKQTRIFVPLIIIFFLCLLYHPAYFPTLKIFPWFSFNRIPGRSTVIYPIILSIFALHINLNWLQNRKKQIITTILVLLACTELYTIYSFKLNYQPYVLDKNFFAYMNYVKQQPGEAVLDWPFCAAGGNSVGSLDGLCPYFYHNGSVYSFRRFHHKKVMGQYFGRLHPSQIQPYLQAGWHHLLVPNSLFYLEKTSPKIRCFNSEEWSFFTDFYRFNDFAGINLYTDLLSENCVQEFYSRFGKPTIETRVPETGKVSFIPKSPKFSNQVNLALGSQIKFEPLLNFSESNLLDIRSQSTFISVIGLSGFEEIPPKTFRWALGPETNIVFQLKDSQLLNLSFKFENPIEAQNVLIEVNGVPLDSFKNLNPGASIDRNLKFKAVKGINRIVFKYKDWNHHQTTFAPKDDRTISVQFKRLTLEPAKETSL